MLARPSTSAISRTARLAIFNRVAPKHRIQPHQSTINRSLFHTTTTTSNMSSDTVTPPRAPTFNLTQTSITELNPYILPTTLSLLSHLLSANHVSHHCFFNTRGMHNHSIHQLLAATTLSAEPTRLSCHDEYQIAHYLGSFSLNDRAHYDPYVSPDATSDRGKPIEKINTANWTEHLGNARYFWSYLHFFDAQL